MPPKRGRGGAGGAGRGAGRGGGPVIAAAAPSGAGRGGAASAAAPSGPPSHVATVGVKRPGFGKSGRAVTVITNHFPCKIPTGIIYHYDGAYDGQKNLFTTKKLDLGETDTRTFEMPLGEARGDRPPRTRKIKITLVAEINPEVLAQFQLGRHAQDNEVQTALTALNVALRHEPISRYAFNTRSFFLPNGIQKVGFGLQLWPGVFQSIRPAISSMHLNVDTSTGVIFTPGPLITHSLEFLERRLPADLARLNSRDLRSLAKKSIMDLTDKGASQFMFESNGKKISVADYFKQTYKKTLQFPQLPCVKVSQTSVIPMEFCEVLPGQLMRKGVPKELTDDMVKFSRRKPSERLTAIKTSLSALNHQSAIVSQFGITVETNPVECPARVLMLLKFRGGVWNLRNERLKQPAVIKGWIMAIFERRQVFTEEIARKTIDSLKAACTEKGIQGLDTNPLIEWVPAQGDTSKILTELGGKFKTARGALPNLIVAIMPRSSGDIYPFGDVMAGVATQCMKADKAKGQNTKRLINRINVKLGGVNSVLMPSDETKFLTDPANPTMIMGLTSLIPPPVLKADRLSQLSWAVSIRLLVNMWQPPSPEVSGITDLQEMAEDLIRKFQGYQKMVEKRNTLGPKRILFIVTEFPVISVALSLTPFTHSGTEGQFKFVLENEVPALQRACKACGVDTKITFVIVGKRHHTRMFPKDKANADKSENCLAGTVVDQVIGHPLEFDFFLLSHAGLIGTSRPAHYSVVHDDNNFTPDSLQKLTFALCHVYARATRSVSIPPPVYYADIVCGRARHHLPPDFDMSDSATIASGTDAEALLERIKAAYRPTHPTIARNMYFQ
ncbi:protein argonaute 1 [Rhizoctonia solani]|uniref:Protein argonaute 1 n=1 Tax=Rhizoctonia solani TaxID=456999 RepID=A0A8H8PBJ1_9AGAM|nr:protein argonaute 1 [Rhizoctonia solani]QRW26912.1 protein argonaute 1 [Rhizoctonia solani]